MTCIPPETTEGTLLGGRVIYRQPAGGFRSGIEPVLAAAAVPARPGERVIEAGTGAGAGLLCLRARVPGVSGTGFDTDASLIDLARANADANGFALNFQVGDITILPARMAVDHAFANPPYHLGAGTPPSLHARHAAKHAGAGTVATWTRCLASWLRSGGTLTLILSTACMAEAIGAMAESGLGGLTIQPLWPRAGSPAKLAILQARASSSGATRLLPGLVLHATAGWTEAANAIFHDCDALIL